MDLLGRGREIVKRVLGNAEFGIVNRWFGAQLGAVGTKLLFGIRGVYSSVVEQRVLGRSCCVGAVLSCAT